ncbi:MAG: thioredoxin domain-containing protein [Acidobacteria bacterium]|nr:thioredoxin domain-containing protein [Acidobacteriota bacterium]
MPLNAAKNRLALSLLLLAALAAPAAVSGQIQPSAPRPDPAAACGCESSPLPEVLATVNGIRVTRQDISPEARKRVADLQQQVVEARRRELESQIDSALLEAEAKRRGVSAAKLLEAEVLSKAPEPTEADAQKFYDENRARIDREFRDVKEEVVSYLREARRREVAAKFSETLRASARVKRLAAEATPPASEAELARVLASVDGRDITSAEVEESLRPLVYGVQEQVYRLREQEVELRVNGLLLGEEARRRGVTPRALLDAEVVSKIQPVTEADAQKFYEENRARIDGDFAQTKEQIVQYLRDLAEQKAQADFAARLRAAAQVRTFLVAPPAPVYKIATDGQPAKGNPAASVTVVEFTDYQCPSCAAAQPHLERVMAEYGDRVRLVVRDYPLPQHADAQRAAEAAEAAREQGKYWEYATLLYQNQSALRAEKLKEYAARVGLDRAKFDAALDSGRFADDVSRDLRDGERAGVNGTPTVFVNGVRVQRATYELLKAAIDAALKTTRTE